MIQSWEAPKFTRHGNETVTTLTGEDNAILHCQIQNIGNNTVSLSYVKVVILDISWWFSAPVISWERMSAEVNS